MLRQATTDIIKLLTVPLTKIGPVLQGGDETRNSVLQVAKFLNKSEKIPATLPTPEYNTAQLPRVTKDNAPLARVGKNKNSALQQ